MDPHDTPAGPLARAVAWTVGRATTGEPARVFTALGRHRRLFRTWLPFAATLLLRTRLPRADVELVILRTACNCSSAYEWAQHVPLAYRAGLDPAAVAAAVGAGTGAGEAGDRGPVLSARQRLLLDAVDELHSQRRVSPATWGALGACCSAEELLELCMLVGHYTMLAMTLNTFGVTPEPAALAALGPAEREAADRLQAPAGR